MWECSRGFCIIPQTQKKISWLLNLRQGEILLDSLRVMVVERIQNLLVTRTSFPNTKSLLQFLKDLFRAYLQRHCLLFGHWFIVYNPRSVFGINTDFLALSQFTLQQNYTWSDKNTTPSILSVWIKISLFAKILILKLSLLIHEGFKQKHNHLK